MASIIEITTDQQKKELARVIREANRTVARDLNLTKENAPTNPAFITYEALEGSMNKGLAMYGFYEDKKLVGCVGIEDPKKDDTFYIERLAVLPLYRHNGIGRRLMDFAFEKIKSYNGKTVSIRIIDENNTVLSIKVHGPKPVP